MIEDMEAELTEVPKKTPNNENLAVAEEAKVDKPVTAEANDSNDTEIDLKEEIKIQAYKEKMNIEIDNINTFEKINKVYTTQRRTIYEVIEPNCFK